MAKPYKSQKKAYRKAKRKLVSPWKVLTITCLIVCLITTALSVAFDIFDNTRAAFVGGSFWELENEDPNAQYFTSDFASVEEMTDRGQMTPIGTQHVLGLHDSDIVGVGVGTVGHVADDLTLFGPSHLTNGVGERFAKALLVLRNERDHLPRLQCSGVIDGCDYHYVTCIEMNGNILIQFRQTHRIGQHGVKSVSKQIFLVVVEKGRGEDREAPRAYRNRVYPS